MPPKSQKPCKEAKEAKPAAAATAAAAPAAAVAAKPAPKPKASAPAPAPGTEWLGRYLRLTIVDGRIIEGKLEMFDSQGNITLAEPIQRLPYPEGEVQRQLVRVAVGAKDIVKIEEGVAVTAKKK